MVEPNLTSYDTACRSFSWAEAEAALGLGNKLNIAQAAVDINCERGLRDKVALRFYDGTREQAFTFGELKVLSDRFALVLVRGNVRAGDRVVLFGRSSPEFYISLLGVIKAGAVAVPIFEGYMAEALNEIIQDSGAVALVTTAALKNRVNRKASPHLKQMFVIGPLAAETPAGEANWHKVVAEATGDLEVALVDRESPFALLYTSGSTGKPKGVILSHGGLVQYYQTGRWVMDFHAEDTAWCTADLGWVTGITYGALSPWLNGVTTAVYAGGFGPEGWYGFIQRFRVTVWYTTPSAFRLLMAGGEKITKRFDFSSLRHILSVGEALNPAIIRWTRGVFGIDACDTWFMTETGAQMVANFRCLPLKPGSMGKPVPGIQVAVLNSKGQELGPLEMGQLAVKPPWPAMMRGIWKDEDKYAEYFRDAWYLSGDLVYRDREGYYWYQGRADDIIKVGERRVGPFEVESKLMEHPAILEAGVIGKADFLQGESIKAFLVLRPGHRWSPKLQEQLQAHIDGSLAEHMVPKEFEVCTSLPYTRTGKLLRRVLKAREIGLPETGADE